ncbi:nitroreductase family protein [bacterium]|nr:nitroreductase family protein [candidate division CSSED10-310 bacterium]
MELSRVIHERRAYRSLGPAAIDRDLIEDLARHAQLAPSCYNRQPWRFVFVHDRARLEQLFTALPAGNAWATHASMIIAVFSKRDLDCDTQGRQYFLFDTGMGTAFLILRATELGLVAHPIAGYSEPDVKRIVNIPDEMTVITLVIVGRHSSVIAPYLSEQQARGEAVRPPRFDLDAFVFENEVPQEMDR